MLDKHENVKLCDFGFTREYEGKLNNLQTFCGTVCYAAPEMLKGEKYSGEKVDVWSLGIILYALLAGELPFDDDDDMVTKHKILTTEPQYPNTFPVEARVLLSKLLSKRPLLRPALTDILTDPFLAPHAPNQQAILKVTRPAPFTTDLEKITLERMRSAGVDIDQVIEHVLAQRCDALGGWWSLLIEKEERKEKRRERKRKEREQEIKSLRRISVASNRRASTLQDVDEEETEQAIVRGRKERRSIPSRTSFHSHSFEQWLTLPLKRKQILQSFPAYQKEFLWSLQNPKRRPLRLKRILSFQLVLRVTDRPCHPERGTNEDLVEVRFSWSASTQTC